MKTETIVSLAGGESLEEACLVENKEHSHKRIIGHTQIPRKSKEQTIENVLSKRGSKYIVFYGYLMVD